MIVLCTHPMYQTKLNKHLNSDNFWLLPNSDKSEKKKDKKQSDEVVLKNHLKILIIIKKALVSTD